MYEVQGVIKVIFDNQTFKNDFVKREFVVTTEENYPQDIKLECIRDRCALLDNFQAGDLVKAFFNLRGNEYNGRYYVNLQAWKIEKRDAETGKENQPTEQIDQREETASPIEPEDDPFQPGL